MLTIDRVMIHFNKIEIVQHLQNVQCLMKSRNCCLENAVNPNKRELGWNFFTMFVWINITVRIRFQSRIVFRVRIKFRLNLYKQFEIQNSRTYWANFRNYIMTMQCVFAVNYFVRYCFYHSFLISVFWLFKWRQEFL